jgi:hypothetical protein
MKLRPTQVSAQGGGTKQNFTIITHCRKRKRKALRLFAGAAHVHGKNKQTSEHTKQPAKIAKATEQQQLQNNNY